MSGVQKNILTRSGRKSDSFIRSAIVLCCVLLSFHYEVLWAQVISNTGAIMSVTSGTVVYGGDIENTSGAVSNAGTISLTGSYTNADTTDGNGTYNIAGNLTISGGTFDLGTGTANRTSSGGVLSLSVGATLKLGGSSGGVTGSNLPDSFATVTLNGTVEFNGTGAQTIPAFNYTNLTSSSTGARTLVSSGTIGIAGSFTLGTNLYTVTGSLIDYNGTSAQTIASFTYNNLTVSNAVDTSAANYKTAANTLTVGGALTINSGNTLDMGSFASSTFGGSSTNSGKIRWSADNVYVSGIGTTEFYGSTSGNIAVGTSYGNMWFTGNGAKTILAGVSVTALGGNVAFGVTVSHNLTVASTATLTVTGMDLNNNGTITNGGTISVNQ